MSSPCRDAVRVAALTALLAGCTGRAAEEAVPATAVLRVCADPNNLPFSNERSEGLENALAELIAGELEMRLEYTWWAQRRGFLRNTLRAGVCDVVPGIAASSELVLATRPYYRSTYVFATRAGRPVRVTSMDDPELRSLRIGVHVIGDDYTNTPPAHALAARGIVNNVRGYSVYGDYARPNPTSELVEALLQDEIDVAIVWGPFAGWAAARGAPIEMVPVSPQVDLPFLPFVFDIAMGVRREDTTLRARLDSALVRRQDDITALLARFGVPLVATPGHRVAARPAGGAR